jgi:hypothetical protein
VRRLAALTAACTLVVVVDAMPAEAGNSVGAFDNPADGTVGATATAAMEPSQAPPSGSGAAAATQPCLYTWIPGTDLSGPDGSTDGAWGVYKSGPTTCHYALGPGIAGPLAAFWVPGKAPGSTAPAPEALAVQALSETQIASPQVETWPPTGDGVVNHATWVHVTAGWAQASASASAGAVSVTVTATPTSVTLTSWDSADGGASYARVRATCPGPGAAYDRNRPFDEQHTDCSIAWRWPSNRFDAGATRGSYPLDITVTYRVDWVASGGPGGSGALASITRTTTIDYPVGEIQAVGS